MTAFSAAGISQQTEGKSREFMLPAAATSSSAKMRIRVPGYNPVPGGAMSGWEEFPRMLLNLAVAFVLGVPIGWERGDRTRPGLRTYPLLAMGACAYLEIGHFAFHNDVEAQARVFQGLVSGIGFIGAGAIIKGPIKVRGLATAVSLWVTVAIGIAASYQLFALAALLSVTTLLVLWAFDHKKHYSEEAKNPGLENPS